ncbi:MAG: hypothetical protein V1905_03480 [bacterium]
MDKTKRAGELPMISQDEHEAVERAMQDPEFQRLLPGYQAYEKADPPARKPIIHGTGSYALRRIIKNGFVPQKSVLSGERAHRFGSDEARPTCFNAPENGGEKFSHWYGDLAARDNQLSFDADRYLKSRTMRIVEDVIGGVDARVNEVSLREINNLPEADLVIGKEKAL